MTVSYIGVGPQAGAARMLSDNLRFNLGPIRSHLAEIDNDPTLTAFEGDPGGRLRDVARAQRKAPLLEEAQKIRDTLLAASRELITKAREKYAVSLPRSQRRMGGARNPKQVTETMQLALTIPVSELEALTNVLIEDGDDASLYGLELGVAKREDVPLHVRGTLANLINTPYMNGYKEAKYNLLVTQQEHAQMYAELDLGSNPADVVGRSHDALEILDLDGSTRITVSEAEVDEAYAALCIPRSV